MSLTLSQPQQPSSKKSHQKKIETVKNIDPSISLQLSTLFGFVVAKNVQSGAWHVTDIAACKEACVCVKVSKCTRCNHHFSQCHFVDVNWDLGNFTGNSAKVCLLCRFKKRKYDEEKRKDNDNKLMGTSFIPVNKVFTFFVCISFVYLYMSFTSMCSIILYI